MTIRPRSSLLAVSQSQSSVHPTLRVHAVSIVYQHHNSPTVLQRRRSPTALRSNLDSPSSASYDNRPSFLTSSSSCLFVSSARPCTACMCRRTLVALDAGNNAESVRVLMLQIGVSVKHQYIKVRRRMFASISFLCNSYIDSFRLRPYRNGITCLYPHIINLSVARDTLSMNCTGK